MTDEFKSLLSQVQRLTTIEKIRLVELILPEVESAFSGENKTPRRRWKGIYRDNGPVPGEEDIAQMRREVWPQS